MLVWLLRLFSRREPSDTLFGIAHGDVEIGYSFERAELTIFLTRVNDRLAVALPVAELVDFAMTTPLYEERTRPITLRYQGAVCTLDMRVVRENAHAPDIHFSTASGALGDAVMAQLTGFVDEAERRLPG